MLYEGCILTVIQYTCKNPVEVFRYCAFKWNQDFPSGPTQRAPTMKCSLRYYTAFAQCLRLQHLQISADHALAALQMAV